MNEYQPQGVATFGITSPDTVSAKGAVVDILAKAVHLVRPGKWWPYPLQYNDEDIAGTCMTWDQRKFEAKELIILVSALACTVMGHLYFTKAWEKTSRAFRKLPEHPVPPEAPALEPLKSDRDVVTHSRLLWGRWKSWPSRQRAAVFVSGCEPQSQAI